MAVVASDAAEAVAVAVAAAMADALAFRDKPFIPAVAIARGLAGTFDKLGEPRYLHDLKCG